MVCGSSGSTTLSASGMLFPTSILGGEAKLMSEDGQEDMALVLTVASLVEPFLTLGHRTSVSQVRYNTCSNYT